MSSEQARDLRQRGIAAAKAGQKDEARQLLQQSIRIEADNEAAWLWLASVARDGREREFCLRKLLEINPNNEMALKALSQSGSGSSPGIRAISGMKVSEPAAPTVDAPGVPVPPADRIAEAQKAAETAVREFLAPVQDGVKYVRKTRRRAGEADVLALRAQVAAGVISFIAVIGVLGTLFVLNNADARALLFAPTWTPSFTPTSTATPTRGVTPTPSPTPALTYTPSPTVPPEITPFNPYFPPRATDPYPRVESQPLREAVALIEAGAMETALPTLDAERAAVAQLFNPSPFYYQAVALAKLGESERALRLLEDAEAQLNPNNTRDFKPIIDAGYARVYAELANQAFTRGRDAEGRGYLEQAEVRAEAALEGDPRNPDAYLALAQRHRQSGDFGQALQVLNTALARPELETNVNLIVERGEVYFEQEEYDLALYQAFLARYIDEQTEAAHLLQIRVAMAQDDPGLAVIYAQNYLFYFPGSVAGWKLLGDARRMEDKDDLALEAYTQALSSELETSDVVAALLARASVYEDARRYEQAREDLTRAYAISDDDEVRLRRMRAAFAAGNYATAIEDAEALLGSGVVSDGELNLVRAQSLIESAGDADTDAIREAAGLLAGLDNIPASLLPTANEYFARAQYALGSYDDALAACEAALAAGETGRRHFLRGLILEAQGDEDGARRAYEWVVAWSEIVPFEFRVEAQERLEGLE